MKASQGVFVIGWIILCSAIIFLFNEQLSSQLPILQNYATNISNVFSFTDQGRQSFTRPMIYTERPSSATLKSTTSTTTTITTSTSTTSSQIASLPQNVSCLRMNLNLTHPQTSIVASLGNGRLGNQLSNFASCFAIWKEYGMYPYLDSMQLGLIEKVFDLPKLEDTNNASYHLWNKDCIKEGTSIPWQGISEDQLVKSRSLLEKYKNDTYVKLGPYINDIQGYYPFVGELKSSIFKFKKDDMRYANTIYQSIKNTYSATKKHKINGNITMVSIHVRLTDFAHHLKVLFNMTFISNEFLTEAMTYYNKKYQNVLFYALSDDIKSARDKLLTEKNNRFNIVFPGDGDISSPAIDMALLSLADHSIISYGTFGMWGALLAGRGETVMSQEFLKTDVGAQIKVAITQQHIKNWSFLGHI